MIQIVCNVHSQSLAWNKCVLIAIHGWTLARHQDCAHSSSRGFSPLKWFIFMPGGTFLNLVGTTCQIFPNLHAQWNSFKVGLDCAHSSSRGFSPLQWFILMPGGTFFKFGWDNKSNFLDIFSTRILHFHAQRNSFKVGWDCQHSSYFFSTKMIHL